MEKLNVTLMESDDVLDFINALDDKSKSIFLEKLKEPRFVGGAVLKEEKECICIIVFEEGLRGVRGELPEVGAFLGNACKKELITQQEYKELMNFFFTAFSLPVIFV